MKLDNYKDEKMINQLELIKTIMNEKVRSGDAILNGSLEYALAAGGKMLRPTLLLIGARLGSSYAKHEEKLIDLCAAIETIHLATLIHDDVIDESKLRRGSPSVQAKYGQAYAVYMGDYLLSQSFLMLTHLDLKKDLAILMAKAVSKICVGDMKQYNNRYNVDVTPTQYIKAVSGKTCALMSIALSSGAYYCKAKDQEVKILARIGYYIGMIFQLVDDLLDYTGDVGVVGKDLQADILNGYYNMPIILALKSRNEAALKLKQLLNQDIHELELKQIYSLIEACEGIDKTRDLISKYEGKARQWIELLPNSETKSMLDALVPYFIKRVK